MSRSGGNLHVAEVGARPRQVPLAGLVVAAAHGAAIALEQDYVAKMPQPSPKRAERKAPGVGSTLWKGASGRAPILRHGLGSPERPT